MSTRYLFLVAISGAAIVVDQLTKIYVHTHFAVGESVSVIPGFFNITYARNPGAAFGFLARSHPEFRDLFFLIIPVIAVIVILNILRTVQDNDKVQIVSLSLIFGGAIGNYIDRLRFRFVIDFLDVHWKDVYYWPTFNVADSCIVVGVCIMGLLMLKSKKEKSQETT